MDYRSYTWENPNNLKFYILINDTDAILTLVTHTCADEVKEIVVPPFVMVKEDGEIKKKEITSIDFMTFSDFKSLEKIIIPKTVKFIDEDATFCCPKKLEICCEKDSFVYEWAQKSGYTTSSIFSAMEKFLNSPEDFEKSNNFTNKEAVEFDMGY